MKFRLFFLIFSLLVGGVCSTLFFVNLGNSTLMLYYGILAFMGLANAGLVTSILLEGDSYDKPKK